ncbi:GNAT family N-acetyltransferase [Deminuibacter soli]|uniref:N-acetyltransferase n=1 Tax=Deminuibacter soli TaxID=2291815 RepID=A0A3E1NJX9_9BACT|nr:GNAT family N-acetyltransferase [Deminuibacter soli]RFM28232.1 N-acetyltransferase [Deminuibacter soli]
MNVSFKTATLADAEELTRMSMDFYSEIPTRKDRAVNRIAATVHFYKDNSNMGEVMLIECDHNLAGYAIAFRFWSDEYGGLMLGLDCLYVEKKFRHKGIARKFLNSYITREKSNPHVTGIEIESYEGNPAAARLAQSVGLAPKHSSQYILLFKQH